MKKNFVLFGYFFYFIINLAFYIINIELSKEYILVYCLFVGLTLIYFFKNCNFIVLAYLFCFTVVLFTAYLLQELSERVQFNGWMQENLFNYKLMSQTNEVIMIAISSFSIGAILTDRGNKRLFKSPIQHLDFYERKAKNWVALLSVLIGFVYAWMNGAPTLGEAKYASAGNSQEFGQEFSSFGYIIGVVFSGVGVYLAYHGSSFKSNFVRLIFGLTLFVVLYFNLYSGDRDGTLTFAILFLGIFWIYNKMSEIKKSLIVVFAGVILYFFLLLVGAVRSEIASKGIVGAVSEAELFKNGQAFSPTENLDLLPIMYWQTLASARLINEGNYFGMKSFLNLIPQSIPTPVANFFGYTRPINIAWELGKYHEHGGGYFIIGESYWNGGIVGVIFVFALLGVLLINLERWFYKQEKYLLAFYFGLIASSPTCIYYAFQGMARWIEVWVGFALFFKIWIATVKAIEKKDNEKNLCVE